MEPDSCAQQPASSQGVYLYCFAHPTVAGQIEAAGIDDRTEVTSLTVGEVAAVFSKVSLEDFIGPSGDANLRDLSWIVPRARQHERVVEAVMNLSPVLPARFGTVLSCRSVLEQLAAGSAEKIRQFLDRMVSREEWSIKAFLDVPKAVGWMLTSQAAPVETPERDHVSPGVGYIQGKRLRTCARRRVDDWSRRTAEEIGRLIAIHAVDVRPLRLQSGGTSGKDGKMILNCALLVSQDRVAELRERASEIEAGYADAGLSLSISGPWPPYSFCPSVLDIESCE
jgi:hypothetical protein